MHDLAPLRLASGDILDWALAPIPGTALTDLVALHIKALPAGSSRLQATLGFAEAGSISVIGSVDSLWMGPGEWLLVTSAAHGEQLEALGRRAANHGAGVVDAQDGLAIIELDVDADLLAGLAGLPSRGLRPGCVARTRLADVPVMIAAAATSPFRLIFDRTHAPHFRAWLDRAI